MCLVHGYELILGVYPAGWNTDYSASVLFLRSPVQSCWVYTLFLLLPPNTAQLSSHNSHHVFIISSLVTDWISNYITDGQPTWGGGWGPAQTSLWSRNKNSLHCLYLTRQANRTGPSELRLVLVIVLVRQTCGDQARRSEIWKACYHHHHSTGRHRFYRKILHHNPCLTESP